MARPVFSFISASLAIPLVISSSMVASAATMNYLPWSTAKLYAAGSVVSYNKQTYVALVLNKNRVPTLNLNTTWRLIGTNFEYRGDWVQPANPPTSAAPAYFTGAAVRYAGNLYVSLSDNNLTLPNTPSTWAQIGIYDAAGMGGATGPIHLMTRAPTCSCRKTSLEFSHLRRRFS